MDGTGRTAEMIEELPPALQGTGRSLRLPSRPLFKAHLLHRGAKLLGSPPSASEKALVAPTPCPLKYRGQVLHVFLHLFHGKRQVRQFS